MRIPEDIYVKWKEKLEDDLVLYKKKGKIKKNKGQGQA